MYKYDHNVQPISHVLTMRHYGQAGNNAAAQTCQIHTAGTVADLLPTPHLFNLIPVQRWEVKEIASLTSRWSATAICQHNRVAKLRRTRDTQTDTEQVNDYQNAPGMIVQSILYFPNGGFITACFHDCQGLPCARNSPPTTICLKCGTHYSEQGKYTASPETGSPTGTSCHEDAPRFTQ